MHKRFKTDREREKARGRTDSGGMGKKTGGKLALVMQAMINIKREKRIYFGMNGTLRSTVL